MTSRFGGENAYWKLQVLISKNQGTHFHRIRCLSIPTTGIWYTVAWSSLIEGDEGYIGPSGKLLCFGKPPKSMQHMDGIISYLFDYWANPVVHLLLLKASMPFEIAI